MVCGRDFAEIPPWRDGFEFAPTGKGGESVKRIFWVVLCAWMLVFAGMAECADVMRYMSEQDAMPNLRRDDLLEVHWINVASADCILLRIGERTMLIDSGRLKEYERITKYFQEIGVAHLDYVFETHPHDDHIGGFVGVLDEIPVGTYLKPRHYESYSSSLKTRLNRVIQRNQIPTEFVETGQQMYLGQARLTFYQWASSSVQQNNRSVVLKVEYGSRTVLLAADLEATGQRKLAELYGSALRADILKVPHHGINDYAQEFHDAVQPAFATISNTRKSADKFVTGLTRRNVPWVFTTKGTIIAVTEGDQWHVWQIPNPDASPGEGTLAYIRR